MSYSYLARLIEGMSNFDTDSVKVTDDPKEKEITSSPVIVIPKEDMEEYDKLFSDEPEVVLGNTEFFVRLGVYKDRPYIFNKAIIEKTDKRYSIGDMFHLEGPKTGYVDRLKEDVNTVIIPDDQE